jgi:hypothetical protein
MIVQANSDCQKGRRGRDRLTVEFTTTCTCAIGAYHHYRDSQFYWWRKRKYQEKSTDPPQVTDELYYIMFY